MNLKEFTTKLLEFRRGIISKSFLNHNPKTKVELYILLDFLDKFLKKSNLKEINKQVQALLVKLLAIYNAWDKQDNGDERDVNKLSRKMLGTEEYSMSTLKQDIDNIIQLCDSSEIKQDLNYEDFIVSTNDVVRFIHKTRIELAEDIMKKGFKFGFHLPSTATMCSKDLTNAKQNFLKKHQSSNVAILLEFPYDLWMKIRQELRDEGDYQTNPSEDDRFSTVIKNKSESDEYAGFERIIKPQFIMGYIDLRDNSVHLNPYRNH